MTCSLLQQRMFNLHNTCNLTKYTTSLPAQLTLVLSGLNFSHVYALMTDLAQEIQIPYEHTRLAVFYTVGPLHSLQ